MVRTQGGSPCRVSSPPHTLPTPSPRALLGSEPRPSWERTRLPACTPGLRPGPATVVLQVASLGKGFIFFERKGSRAVASL